MDSQSRSPLLGAGRPPDDHFLRARRLTRSLPPNRRKSSAPIAMASTRPEPIIARLSVCAPEAGAGAGPLAEGADDAGSGVGVADVAGAEVVTVVADRVAVGEAAAVVALVRLVMMLALQDTVDPPTLPVPLHWVILIGITRLTLDPGSTVQRTVPPPPLPEPLHWVTMAPDMGEGLQSGTPPPPRAEPTHWVTLGAVTGCTCGVSRLMLLVILTLQVMVCAASLSELLHCRMAVTRLAELVVKVPFGVEQGPSRHSRVTVVVERVVVPLMVLTTVTVHLSAVVAPAAAGPWPLHWSTTIVAALAAVGRTARLTIEKAPVSIIRATTMTRQVGWDALPGAGRPRVGVPDIGVVSVVIKPASG